MDARNITHNCTKLNDIHRQSATSAYGHLPEAMQHRDSVLIIDASGSMYDTDWEPSRLEAAKQAAVAFLRRLLSEEPDARPYTSVTP